MPNICNGFHSRALCDMSHVSVTCYSYTRARALLRSFSLSWSLRCVLSHSTNRSHTLTYAHSHTRTQHTRSRMTLKTESIFL